MGPRRTQPRTNASAPRGVARGLESVRQASSLPSGVFSTRAPSVEQALAGGVAEVFLRHMARLDGPADVAHGERTMTAPGADRDPVTPDDVTAMLDDLRETALGPPPRLDEGLCAERAWVLIDLALRGSEPARRTSTIELLQIVARMSSCRAAEAAPLRALVRLLDSDAALDAAPLLVALCRAANSVLGPEAAT